MRKCFLASCCAILFSLVAGRALPADPQPAVPLETLQKERIQRAEERFAEAEALRRHSAAQLSDIRAEVRAMTGLVEVTPEAIRQVIGKLQEQREQLALDGAGAAGRRQGLDEAMDELTRKLKDRATADPVADELAKVVEIRQQQVTRLQALKANATVSQEELDIAVANVAKARAEMAAARQKAAGGSNEVLDSWNRQRLELTVSEQERQARLKYITKRLDAFSKALNQLDKLEELRSRLDQADRALVKAQDELDAARQKIELRITYEQKKAGEEPSKP